MSDVTVQEGHHLWTCSYQIWLDVTGGLYVSLEWCFAFLLPSLPTELPERGSCFSFWCFLQFTSKVQMASECLPFFFMLLLQSQNYQSFSFTRYALGCRWRSAHLSLSFSLQTGSGRSLPPAVSALSPRPSWAEVRENSPGWIHVSQEPLQRPAPQRGQPSKSWL